jgi:signal transduction histidine kinase
VRRDRLIRLGLVVLGLGFGVAVEWAYYDSALGVGLTAADLAVGCALIGCGAVVWERRAASRIGPLMTLAGFSWFLGNVAAAAAYLHRGPLAHLILAYPSGRVRGRVARAVVGAAYLDAFVRPIARVDAVTLVLAAAVAAAGLRTFLTSLGPSRRSSAALLAAAVGLAGTLALAAVDRIAGWGHGDAILCVHDGVVASIALLLAVDLFRGRWTAATVSGLVVDLGATDGTSGLRARLARALGDPSLLLGYRLPQSNGFVDDTGGALALPAAGSGRTVTRLEHDGKEIGVLVHDEALSADQELVEAVAAAARIAMANARLQAEARAQADQLEASRRRIVEAADRQRRRLVQELRLGPEQLLERAAARLVRVVDRTGGDTVAVLERGLGEARQELRELAQGIRPTTLIEGGLMPALALLAERSPIPVAVQGELGRLAASVESALYFVCSEGLANAVKHAAAAQVAIEVGEAQDRATVAVIDDGVGGAALERGCGLAGLADRLEALGGTLRLESERGTGTRLLAEIPTRQ